MHETISHDKPKKRAFASHDIAKECLMKVLATPLHLRESQQISPNRAKNGVCVLNKDQKGHKMDQKGLNYVKKGFLDQKYLFFAHFFA